jgi:hypothetical protein
MVVSPIDAYVINIIAAQSRAIFWAELAGIYAFATYWCVKTKEMSGLDIKEFCRRSTPRHSCETPFCDAILLVEHRGEESAFRFVDCAYESSTVKKSISFLARGL